MEGMSLPNEFMIDAQAVLKIRTILEFSPSFSIKMQSLLLVQVATCIASSTINTIKYVIIMFVCTEATSHVQIYLLVGSVALQKGNYGDKRLSQHLLVCLLKVGAEHCCSVQALYRINALENTIYHFQYYYFICVGVGGKVRNDFQWSLLVDSVILDMGLSSSNTLSTAFMMLFNAHHWHCTSRGLSFPLNPCRFQVSA